MKYYLSSFSAAFPFLFALAAPALCAAAPAVSDERPLIQETPVFTKYEKDMAKTYPDYFTINPKSVKLTLVAIADEPDMGYVKLQEQPPKDLAGVLVSIDQIVNIASKIWQIVKDNAPVVNIETKYATAYPQGITSASQLGQWSKPRSYTYAFYAENMFGGVMIDCRYKVSYTYNGSYKGKGKYLTAVAVVPEVATVAWGYKFYMSASVPDSTVTNTGTEKDPVAAMQMKLAWKMATVLKESDGTSIYYVQGDGLFEEIANPWKQQPKLEEVDAARTLLAPAEVF